MTQDLAINGYELSALLLLAGLLGALIGFYW